MTTPSRMPVLFAAGGGPNQIDDTRWMSELRAWGNGLPKPRALLVFSAHWEEPVVTLGPTRTVPLTYDFGGFPERYFRLQYPTPGAPQLAARVRALLDEAGIVSTSNDQRGLDHGCFIPLMGLFPDADVPTLSIAMPGEDPQTLFALGRALAPLRDEGVLIVCCGLLVHNLRAMMLAMQQVPGARSFDDMVQALNSIEIEPLPWVVSFDRWVADIVSRRDWDTLLDYRQRAPDLRLAHPTHEHLVPLIIAAGASDPSDAIAFPIEGYLYGTSTKRSVQFG